MAEKKGFLVKLQYPFDTARCLEINYKEDKWIRVTPNEFRSFGGKRRILNIDNTKDAFYEDYDGPVYSFDTNIMLAEKNIIPGFNYPHKIDPRKAIIKRAEKLYRR
jgi:hypothetical protein